MFKAHGITRVLTREEAQIEHLFQPQQSLCTQTPMRPKSKKSACITRLLTEFVCHVFHEQVTWNLYGWWQIPFGDRPWGLFFPMKHFRQEKKLPNLINNHLWIGGLRVGLKQVEIKPNCLLTAEANYTHLLLASSHLISPDGFHFHGLSSRGKRWKGGQITPNLAFSSSAGPNYQVNWENEITVCRQRMIWIKFHKIYIECIYDTCSLWMWLMSPEGVLETP